jgi:hypothetical protein
LKYDQNGKQSEKVWIEFVWILIND